MHGMKRDERNRRKAAAAPIGHRRDEAGRKRRKRAAIFAGIALAGVSTLALGAGFALYHLTGGALPQLIAGNQSGPVTDFVLPERKLGRSALSFRTSPRSEGEETAA